MQFSHPLNEPPQQATTRHDPNYGNLFREPDLAPGAAPEDEPVPVAPRRRPTRNRRRAA